MNNPALSEADLEAESLEWLSVFGFQTAVGPDMQDTNGSTTGRRCLGGGYGTRPPYPAMDCELQRRGNVGKMGGADGYQERIHQLRL